MNNENMTSEMWRKTVFKKCLSISMLYVLALVFALPAQAKDSITWRDVCSFAPSFLRLVDNSIDEECRE